MRLQSVKSKLGERGGCEMASSCSDHARIILALSAIVKNDASSVFIQQIFFIFWNVTLEGASCSAHCK